MNPSDHDERELADSDTDHIGHGVVDEAAGDEGIDDPQADEIETPSL
jgi:hypothetical protein